MGLPCGNCIRSGLNCEVVPRKKYSRRKTAGLARTAHTAPSTEISGHRTLQLAQNEEPDGFAPLHGSTSDSFQSESYRLPRPPTDASLQDESSNRDTEHDGGYGTVALDTAMDTQTSLGENTIPFYFGDAQNGSHFTFELCLSNFSSCPKIYFIPHNSTPRVLAPEDLEYLERKGALSLPADHICDQLLRSYFQHVQPLTPILDTRSFLDQYVSGNPQRPGVLLMYSIFFAAANFADPSTLDAAGFPSRKALKRAMYQRAKALWDIEYEDDKITLIQSAILLSFWYADSTDRAGPWHWAGVAISMCQGLGFHRSLELVVPDSCKIIGYSRLFRRLWWSCFVRDRWLSVTLGRPMRIHLDDCDVPMTTVDDITHEWADIPLALKDRYFPSDYHLLAHCWVHFVKLTVVLGKVIAVHYSPNKPRPGRASLEMCEDELRRCGQDLHAMEERPDWNFRLYRHHLQLFHEATTIILYRRYIRAVPSNFPPEDREWFQTKARQKCRSAADRATSVVEDLIELGMIHYLKPMGTSTIVSAMGIHLLEWMSAQSSLSKRLGHARLEICVEALSKLRSTYWGATYACLLFEKAKARILEKTLLTPNSAVDESAVVAAVPDETRALDEARSDVLPPLMSTPDWNGLVGSQAMDVEFPMDLGLLLTSEGLQDLF
ncbi:hypothetical protein AYL99_10660 [Fonsecaea erecta]|uniref:Xylanolytic transcriptional activator regulatory domain-containing protein n=1 Tax=Fonsecaea erecta TaxID=1367422 RepID=A0A178Z5B5_9EURO|nr:hypothetical protein AYL99_10660 [Fonsecaea erecta]OAP54960.1 hypothetical protein AYL99_10660 [Fonsecaea erecta]